MHLLTKRIIIFSLHDSVTYIGLDFIRVDDDIRFYHAVHCIASMFTLLISTIFLQLENSTINSNGNQWQ